VDLGAYEHFIDCNANGTPDELDLMDWNADQRVDLADFAALQVCFDPVTGACLDVFDRAPMCDVLDLEDYVVFELQLSQGGGDALMGGEQGMSMAEGFAA
jgi:hypothetical protein